VISAITNPQVGAGLQTVRAVVRRSALSGNNDVNAEFRLQQSGQAVVSFGTFLIDNAVSQLFTFTFDAALLPDPTGVEMEIVINQTTGGTGGQRAGLDVNACELIYEDGIGSDRLVRHRACDGSCCIAAPRFPNGAGTVEDPHQGSDCIHHNVGQGKQFNGCILIEDIAQQPTAGVKSILKGMEAEDALNVFIDTCVNWPQNTTPDALLGDCCWRWEPDV
jgi:hypothetical protein